MFKLSKDFCRQAITIFPVSVSNFLFGCVYGWIAPALAYFKSDECPFPVSESELTWIASAFFVGEIITPVIGGMFASKVGRKSFIIFATFMQAFSWFIAIVGNSANAVILNRFLLGCAGGLHDQAWSQYVGEVTTPNKRGIFGSLMMSILVGGLMFQFLLSSFLPYKILLIIPFVMATCNLFLTFFIVESPLFLLMKDKDDAAIKTLAWLRAQDNTENVKIEFQEMKEYIDEQMKLSPPSIKEIFKSPSEYKLCSVAVIIFVILNPSGNIIISTYQTIVFDLFRNSANSNNLTVIYGVTQFISSTFVLFLIETAGRKALLLVGFTVSAIIQSAITCLLYVAEANNFEVQYISQILLVLFNIYGVVFMICLCPTAYVLKSELFPQKLKTVGSVISTLTNSLAAFIVVKPFMFISNTYGMYVNFAICSIVCVIGVIYVYLLVPETKGKSLAEIQRKHENKINNNEPKC